jgi:hypothetical protein
MQIGELVRATLGVTLLALLSLVGCARPPAAGDRESPVATSAPTVVPPLPAASNDMTVKGVGCSLVVEPSSGNRHAVSLRVSNARSSPLELRTFHPASFALRAWIDDAPVTLRVPAWESPVEPRTVRVEPGATVTIPTPIALSFGTGSRASDQADPHRWWLDHTPARAKLEGSRAFDSEPALVCTGTLEP